MGEAEEVGQEGEGGLWDEREVGGRGRLNVLQCDV